MSYPIEIQLDSSAAQSLIAVFSDMRSIGIKSIILELTDEPKIRTTNESATIRQFVNFKSGLIDPDLYEESVEFGIYDVTEFAALLSLFKDGATFSLSNTKAQIRSGRNKVVYHGCTIDLVKRPKLRKEPDSICEIDLDDELTPFVKAMGVVHQGYVIINGNAEDSCVTMTITDKDIKTTAFETVINDVDMTQNFRVVHNKENLLAVMKSSLDSTKLTIWDKMIKLSGGNDFFDESFYLAAAI
jgi:hypothetical protein